MSSPRHSAPPSVPLGCSLLPWPPSSVLQLTVTPSRRLSSTSSKRGSRSGRPAAPNPCAQRGPIVTFLRAVTWRCTRTVSVSTRAAFWALMSAVASSCKTLSAGVTLSSARGFGRYEEDPTHTYPADFYRHCAESTARRDG